MNPKLKLEVIFNKPKLNAGYTEPKLDVSTGLPIIRDSSGSDDVFVFHINYDEIAETWIPVESYEEITAGILDAFDNDKEIIISAGSSYNVFAQFDQYVQYPFQSMVWKEYITYNVLQVSAGDYIYTSVEYGELLSGGYGNEHSQSYAYDTSGATATANDVRNLKYFFNEDGRQRGAVPTRTQADVRISGNTITIPAGIYDSKIVITV